MIPNHLIELRMQRIAQMAEKLGVPLPPGSEAARELHGPHAVGACLTCRHEAECCAFTDGDDMGIAAPHYCLNKETFDRLIAAEQANPALSQAELDYLMMLASSISFTSKPAPADPAEDYFDSLPKSAELQSLDIEAEASRLSKV